MSERSKPIVPEVFIINSQKTYWQLATLGRLAVIYATPTTVRCRLEEGVVDKRPTVVGKEVTLQRTEMYCLPDATAWQRVNAARAVFQAALDALATGLRELGSYAQRLAEAGGMKHAPNPLTPTVLSVYGFEPGGSDWGFSPFRVPRIERKGIARHTPKMLSQGLEGAPNGYVFNQRDHIVCPDDAAAGRIETLRSAAQQAHDAWEELLRKLGTYDVAAGDKRYAGRPMSDKPAAIVLAPPVSPALPGALSEPLQAVARNYLGAKRRMEESLLEAARWLAEARMQCKQGEWGMFLAATRTSEGTAKRLLNIHDAAQRSPVLADAIGRGLSATAAAELAQPSTSDDLLEQLLTQEQLPTLEEVRAAKSAKLAEKSPAARGDASEQLRQWNAGEPLRVAEAAGVETAASAAPTALAPALDSVIGEEGALYVAIRMNEGELRREIVLWRRGPLVLHRGSDAFVISHEQLGQRVGAVRLVPLGKAAMERLVSLAYWACPGVSEGRSFPGPEMTELMSTLKRLRDEQVLLPDDAPVGENDAAPKPEAPQSAPASPPLRWPAPNPELESLCARANALGINARVVEEQEEQGVVFWHDDENPDEQGALRLDDARWWLDGEEAKIAKAHARAAADGRSEPAPPRPEPRYTTQAYSEVNDLLANLWSDMQADEPEPVLRSLNAAMRIVVAPLENPRRARLAVALDEDELRALASLVVRNGKQSRRADEGMLDQVLDLVCGRLDAALHSQAVEAAA